MFRPEEITVHSSTIKGPAPIPDGSDNPYMKDSKPKKKKKKNDLLVPKEDKITRSHSVRKAIVNNRLTVQPDFAEMADQAISKIIKIKEQKKIQASLIKKIGELEVDESLLDDPAQSMKIKNPHFSQMNPASLPATQFEPADDMPLLDQNFEEPQKKRKGSNIGFENFYHRAKESDGGEESKRSMTFVPAGAGAVEEIAKMHQNS